MSETNTDSRAVSVLRSRAADIRVEIRLLEVRLAEIDNAIDMIERAGRKRPGPKPGAVRLADPIEMPMRVGGSASSPDPEAA